MFPRGDASKTNVPALLALALAGALGACLNDPLPPGSAPPPGTKPVVSKCTPEKAGLPDAPTVDFSYVHLPDGCTLDPVGRAGICYIGGCTVKDELKVLTHEAELQGYLSCTSPDTPTGVDFAQHRVLFVRQGLRVGETMSVQPVGWVVDQDDVVTFGENRQSFCTGGQPITGGIVSYAVLLPIPTSSTSTIARHICFRRTRCDCSEEESCG